LLEVFQKRYGGDYLCVLVSINQFKNNHQVTHLIINKTYVGCGLLSPWSMMIQMFVDQRLQAILQFPLVTTLVNKLSNIHLDLRQLLLIPA
jgi:hypothetical protein